MRVWFCGSLHDRSEAKGKTVRFTSTFECVSVSGCGAESDGVLEEAVGSGEGTWVVCDFMVFTRVPFVRLLAFGTE